MPEYLAPGVYVEETSLVHGPIAPSPTSTTAFVGATLKGSLHTATEVSSFAEYRDAFGSASSASPVSLAVLHFFSNGGQKAIVVRAAAGGARGRTRVGFSDVIGEAGKGTGIHALGTSPSPGLLATPDAGAMTLREHHSLVKAVLSYCEEHQIFYIVDVPRLRPKQDSVETVIDWAQRSGALRHPNAAVYFPRLRTSDPSGKSSSILVAEALPEVLPDDGRLILIVGPRTFSAGIVTAAILAARAKGRITIVGERAGDDLQFWAEGGFLTLPNSGLRVHYSDGYHDWRHGYDADDERNRANPRIAAVNARYSAAAGNLDPDPVIPLTFRDYAAGRDPVMEQIRPVLDAPTR